MLVVGSVSSGEEAVALFDRYRPDITLMDLQLGGISGVEAIEAIRRKVPSARIIVLTMYKGDEDIFRALKAGAATYLLKDMLSEDLIKVVRDVHSGRQPIANSDVQARLAARASQPTLTPREVQIVEMISRGLRNKEIAAALDITEETVQVHIRNIFGKLNVQDRTAAVNVSLRRGIIHIA